MFVKFSKFTDQKVNKPRTAKVGAISKAQNCKRGDSLGFVKLQLVAKYEKNELNSVTVSKNVKRGPFGLCETPAGCKIWKKLKGGPFKD